MAFTEVDYLNGGGGGFSNYNVVSLKGSSTDTVTQTLDASKKYIVYLERNADKTQNYKAIFENGSPNVENDSITSTGYATISWSGTTVTMTSSSSNNSAIIEIF